MVDNTHVVAASGTGANMVPAPEMAAFGARLGFHFEAHELGDANRSARVYRHRPSRDPLSPESPVPREPPKLGVDLASLRQFTIETSSTASTIVVLALGWEERLDA
jgi:hypothetical protein